MESNFIVLCSWSASIHHIIPQFLCECINTSYRNSLPESLKNITDFKFCFIFFGILVCFCFAKLKSAEEVDGLVHMKCIWFRYAYSTEKSTWVSLLHSISYGWKYRKKLRAFLSKYINWFNFMHYLWLTKNVVRESPIINTILLILTVIKTDTSKYLLKTAI